MNEQKKKYGFLAAVFGTILVTDQITKQLIHSKFSWGETVGVIPGLFNLTYVRNKGAAFGFLHSAPEAFREPFFLIMPVLAVCILGFLYHRNKPEQKLSAWALCLILGGAVGNLVDRARFGYVVDFLDFYLESLGHWPAFNVADSAIVVGVGLLFLHSLFSKEKA